MAPITHKALLHTLAGLESCPLEFAHSSLACPPMVYIPKKQKPNNKHTVSLCNFIHVICCLLSH